MKILCKNSCVFENKHFSVFFSFFHETVPVLQAEAYRHQKTADICIDFQARIEFIKDEHSKFCLFKIKYNLYFFTIL